MLTASYTQGADLPDLTFEWEDRNGDLIQFASGWSFELRLGTPGKAAVLSKTSGITGSNTAPNVTVNWTEGAELNTIEPGTYSGHLIATRTSDGKDRVLPFRLVVRAAVKQAA